MFKNSEVKKTYWAVVKNLPREEEGELVNYLVRNEKQNKSYAYDKEVPGSKKAILHYRLIGRSQNYYLLEIDLKTGRHHQIRCQLAKMGCPIKGDLKYGSPRSNPDGSICLHARYIRFVHPVSKELIEVEAPVPPEIYGMVLKRFNLTVMKKITVLSGLLLLAGLAAQAQERVAEYNVRPAVTVRTPSRAIVSTSRETSLLPAIF